MATSSGYTNQDPIEDTEPVAPLEFRSLPTSPEVITASAPSFDIEQITQLAFERGQDRGRAEAELLSKQHIESERAAITKTVASFTEERTRYFDGMETELVRLTLAIAERVLHREAQMDALLLAGAVRSALNHLADRSGAVLRVPPPLVSAWSAQMEQLPQPPEVRADETLHGTDCVLETQVGSVDLGVRAQLAEIERGFFDLLTRRPAAS